MNIAKRVARALKNGGHSNTQKEYCLSHGLKVGKNTYIYSWEGLDANWPWLISIGSGVTISAAVQILAHDASPCKAGCRTKLGRVIIGDNVFIGARSVVLCNVTIGDNVIIGAGSVVSRDCESGYVYAGNPARKICTMEEYHNKHLKMDSERPDLSKIRKWDDWENATEEEKQLMINLLSDGCGYI